MAGPAGVPRVCPCARLLGSYGKREHAASRGPHQGPGSETSGPGQPGWSVRCENSHAHTTAPPAMPSSVPSCPPEVPVRSQAAEEEGGKGKRRREWSSSPSLRTAPARLRPCVACSGLRAASSSAPSLPRAGVGEQQQAWAGPGQAAGDPIPSAWTESPEISAWLEPASG